MLPDSYQQTPFATWNPVRGVWETIQEAICGHSEPFSATWPKSGSMRDGEVFSHPMSALPTDGNASSSSLVRNDPRPGPLLTTPVATEKAVGRPHRYHQRWADLTDQVAYVEQQKHHPVETVQEMQTGTGQVMWEFQ